MANLPPLFADCYGYLAERFTARMQDIVPGVAVFNGEPDGEDELIRRLQGRRNVLIYMGFMSARVLRACPDLKSIAYLSTGLATHGDLTVAAELGIAFEGVKGYGDRAVAEHTIALALGGLKRLAEMDRAVRRGQWRLMRSEEFQGKTFGVIGLGGIGTETAAIASVLGANVIGWTRSGGAPDAPVTMMELDAVLEQSDILSMHLALNEQTQGFLDAAKLSRTKPGVIILNTARAGVIDYTALIDELASGHIGHAGLDVFHDEPLPTTDPLAQFENVTLTPHSAWLSTQAIDRLLMAGMELLRHHIEVY